MLARSAQQLTEPTWKTNEHGHGVYTAEWFLETTGWLEHQITGENWHKCVAPEDLLRFSSTFYAAIMNRSAYEIEHCVLDNMGRRIAVHVVSTPIFEGKEYRGHSGLLFQV